MNKCNSIECNSIEAIVKADLSEQIKFRLDEISKIENYFIEDINQRKSYSKKLSKYVKTFDYIDQVQEVVEYQLFHLQVLLERQQVQALLYFFSNNRKSKKTTEYNKKQKEKA